MQNLKLFHRRNVLNRDCLDLSIEDTSYKRLRGATPGETVVIETTVSPEQMPAPMVKAGDSVSSVRLHKQYEQLLGPGLVLADVQLLETSPGKTVQDGETCSTGSRLVLSALCNPVRGWSVAVGHRET
jgi:hypothetical protein